MLRGLHGETVETIGSRIVNGYYAPGSQLAPQQLARELGISNTVLREAMRVLADKGLVDSRQKLGTVVQPPIILELARCGLAALARGPRGRVVPLRPG